jgi:hypothetical protein
MYRLIADESGVPEAEASMSSSRNGAGSSRRRGAVSERFDAIDREWDTSEYRRVLAREARDRRRLPRGGAER